MNKIIIKNFSSTKFPTAHDIVTVNPMTADIGDIKFTFHTELEEEKIKNNNWRRDVLIVRNAIREKHPEGNTFIKDSIPCPICKDGTVVFIISDHYNGHNYLIL